MFRIVVWGGGRELYRETERIETRDLAIARCGALLAILVQSERALVSTVHGSGHVTETFAVTRSELVPIGMLSTGEG